MAVEFSLLGDIEARIVGQRLQIGHARQRCVLVALLVDVNHPISADQLINCVWADEPPHRVRNALEGYLSRLRQLLAGSPDVAIVGVHHDVAAEDYSNRQPTSDNVAE